MAICYDDATSSEHQARVDELGPQGWRLTALSVSGDAADPRYTGVWVQRPGPSWQTRHDIPEAGYQAVVTDLDAQGYAPVLVTAAGPPGRVVFAAVFGSGGPPWFAHHGLRWGDLHDPSTITNAMGRAFDSGFIAQSVTTYGSPADPLFAGVWVRNTGRAWAWHWGDLDYYQRTFTALNTAGLHPSDVAVGPGMRLGVFTDDHIGRWWARHDVSAPDYRAEVARAAAEGLRPIAVQVGGGRYAATFAADEQPMPKHWRIDGATIPGAAELDAVFASVLQRFGVRAASVAVAKEGTAYLERAYTWAEDDWPTTTTSTTFRVASVSKLFTAAAIQALADDGVISLSASVFAYLGLSPDAPHDPRADTITILQCATSQSGLPHDFEPGVTFRDISIGLGRQATIQDLAAHLYTVPLVYPPGLPPAGAGDTGYSNSAFHLLGAVVERASGRPLIDYLNTRLALPMGISDLRAGLTAAGRRLPGEVVGYEDAGVGVSQLDLSPGAMEASAYGGNMLIDSAPGTGGLVTSPTSVARFLGNHAAYGIGGRVQSTRYGTFVGSSAAAVSTGEWDFAFTTNREITDAVKDQLREGVIAYLTTYGSGLTPVDADRTALGDRPLLPPR